MACDLEDRHAERACDLPDRHARIACDLGQDDMRSGRSPYRISMRFGFAVRSQNVVFETDGIAIWERYVGPEKVEMIISWSSMISFCEMEKFNFFNKKWESCFFAYFCDQGGKCYSIPRNDWYYGDQFRKKRELYQLAKFSKCINLVKIS